MKILVNDKEYNFQNQSLLQLMQELGLDKEEGQAVAVNDAVVTQPNWMFYGLAENDKVLIIKATQGG